MSEPTHGSAFAPAHHEHRPPAPIWAPWRWRLHWQILLGLILGAILGLAMGIWAVGQIPVDVDPDDRGRVGGEIVRSTILYHVVSLLGQLFMNGLFLIIIPLITTSIILAVARIGGQRDFGRLGGKTLGYYLVTSTIAILIGLVLVNVFTPGIADGTGILVGQEERLAALDDAQREVEQRVEGRELVDFLNVFLMMVPNNLAAAAAEGNFLGLIVVSLIVGYFVTKLIPNRREVFQSFIESVYDLTLMVTHLVLRLAPVGVMFLIARTFAEQHASLWPDARFWEFITGILMFAGVALGALLLHFLVVMPLILVFVARVNPLRHYKAMAPALMTAFSTASSAATLPLTLECVEKRAGVSNRIGGFTIPLGATVNMDGTALYECVAAIFICQAFGVELSVMQQFLIVVVALLTSVGVAGVPAASLVAIAVILQTVQAQLPPEQAVNLLLGMGLLFIFDRPLDMVRTAVNIFGDSVGAVTIARTEGETQVLIDPQQASAAPRPTAEGGPIR